MAHYLRDGEIVGWGPTVEEINHLATLFNQVQHIGCLFDQKAPEAALPYLRENIEFTALLPAGGDSLKDKVDIIKRIPHYTISILRGLKKCDAVHLRCPANVPLIGLIILILLKKPKIRWAKYAGNWVAGKDYPFFYRFQRWLLNSGLPRCEVTVNGSWPEQKDYVHNFYNPCLTEENLRFGAEIATQKKISKPCRLIFVGAINIKKGTGRLLEIANRLFEDGVSFKLDILGDGPDREIFELWCRDKGIEDYITFHSWVSKNELGKYYEKAHINILPSESEGWPKVLSEGMAFGVVPVAGAVASIPQVLEETGSGFAISPYDDISEYVNVINQLIEQPNLWKDYSKKSMIAANHFSYEKYLESVKKLLCLDQTPLKVSKNSIE